MTNPRIEKRLYVIRHIEGPHPTHLCEDGRAQQKRTRCYSSLATIGFIGLKPQFKRWFIPRFIQINKNFSYGRCADAARSASCGSSPAIARAAMPTGSPKRREQDFKTLAAPRLCTMQSTTMQISGPLLLPSCLAPRTTIDGDKCIPYQGRGNHDRKRYASRPVQIRWNCCGWCLGRRGTCRLRAHHGVELCRSGLIRERRRHS